MKNAQYLLAAFGLVSAASSAYVSGYSNETTVWTTVTTDVSTLFEQEYPLPNVPRVVSTFRTLSLSGNRVTWGCPFAFLSSLAMLTRESRSTLRTARRAQPSLRAPRPTLLRLRRPSQSLVSFPTRKDSNTFANSISRLPLHYREANYLSYQANHFCCCSPTTSLQRYLGPSCLDHHH